MPFLLAPPLNMHGQLHFSLSTLTSWDEVRTGILPQPNQKFAQLQIEWDSKYSCVLSKETPWELLRSSILWNIWVAKTQKEIGEESFHLDSILFKSWQITIQMGMAAWKDIFSHNRSTQRRSILIQRFQEAWFHSDCLDHMTTTTFLGIYFLTFYF